MGWNLKRRSLSASLANYGYEDIDGTPLVWGSALRNYFINSIKRNVLIRESFENDSTDIDSKITYFLLEARREVHLIQVIEDIDDILNAFDEFEYMDFITFLYGYIFHDENLPEWQKIEKIKGHATVLKNETRNIEKEISQFGAKVGIGKIEDFENLTARLIRKYREEGKAIVDQLARSISDYSLEDILNEALRYLRNEERKLDFNDILELWDEDSD